MFKVIQEVFQNPCLTKKNLIIILIYVYVKYLLKLIIF